MLLEDPGEVKSQIIEYRKHRVKSLALLSFLRFKKFMVLKRHQRQKLTLRWNRRLLTNVVTMLL